jgi:hypothetical protein
MKYLKMLGLSALAAMALSAILASGASATTLEVTGVKKNEAVTIVATLEPNTSAILKDELGSTTDTCTESTVKGTTTKFTAAGVNPIHGNIETLTFDKCSHTTDVVANGSLSVSWIKGTTNGTVSSSNAEVTVRSTFFGITATCKTGAGTDIGTITGKATGNATMDINGTIDCGSLGNSAWTGSYWVTEPHNLGVVE